MRILVYIEKDSDGKISKESLKLLETAEGLKAESGGQMTLASDAGLAELKDITGGLKPDVIVFASNEKTKVLASGLALSLNTGISSDCFGVKYIKKQDRVHWIRPVYDNSMLAETENLGNKPQIGLLRITTQDPSLRWSEDIPIDDAEIVVCVGRGCGPDRGIELAGELARTLGAAVGATRAVTDLGWLPISKQIGQTGKYIRPRIYIGVGVAGAIQHLAGMRNSDIIIAVNKDYRAPIFEYADYGIVGDLFKVLPIMTERLKDMMSSEQHF